MKQERVFPESELERNINSKAIGGERRGWSRRMKKKVLT
jgi:hypothetical protein